MASRFRHYLATAGCLFIAGMVAGCGGGGSSSGGGGGGGVTPPPGGGGGGGDAGPTYTPGVFEPASEFKSMCEAPRAGTNDVAGSTELENFWLRSWSNETYLWYDEITDRNPGAYSDTLAYFDLLKTDAVTPSGNPKDQFHFTYDTAEYQQLVNSGEEVQYGAEFVLIRSTPPREVRVAFVQDGSPAGNAGLGRGTEILEIDGVSVTNGSDVDTLNNGLFPSTRGESHTFLVQDLGSSTPREVTMAADVIAIDPVQTTTVLDEGVDKVGYLHLTTFGVDAAEEQLIDAMTDFEAAGITDLVLDLRYNGGGFLDISAELGYMIAGPDNVDGRIFDDLVFNDKHPTINPVTGRTLSPTPFHSTSQGFSVAAGQALPHLDLDRVFILSTARTCSASEAVINALRGIDVEVVLIGSTTCGKPYGFYATDNCGTTYFTIQFRGENAKGFGDYADGFTPIETGAPTNQAEIFGCQMNDNFNAALGDPDENFLSAALSYRIDESCVPGPVTSGSAGSGKTTLAASMTPWTQEEPELFLSDPERYGYIDPQSLYASEALRASLRRQRLRDLTISHAHEAGDAQ